MQLRALHGHILLTLTGKVAHRLAERPGADVRPQLAGTRPAMLNLIRIANRMPSVWSDCIPVLALPAAVKASGVWGCGMRKLALPM